MMWIALLTSFHGFSVEKSHVGSIDQCMAVVEDFRSETPNGRGTCTEVRPGVYTAVMVTFRGYSTKVEPQIDRTSCLALTQDFLSNNPQGHAVCREGR